MQTVNKKHGNYYAMALLLVSLTITPVSLKALGISPNLSAGVDVWRQIASLFGENHQPPTAAELIALSDLDTAQPDNAQPEPYLYAEAQPAEPAKCSETALAVAAPQVHSAVEPLRRCPKAASRCAPVMEVNAGVTIERQTSDAIALRVKDINLVDLVKRNARLDRERGKKLEKEIARCQIELGEVLKSLPGKDAKAVLRFRPVAMPLGDPNVEYQFQVPMPSVKRWPRGSYTSAPVQISSIPENAEL